MGAEQMNNPRRALHQLFAAIPSRPAARVADAQLLKRFLTRRSEAEETARAADQAFEALVARHGPMVQGVCGRVLDDPNDADDAFQATFLVLFRRAGAVHVTGSLGPWLYGVARRIALRARADRLRRRDRELRKDRSRSGLSADVARGRTPRHSPRACSTWPGAIPGRRRRYREGVLRHKGIASFAELDKAVDTLLAEDGKPRK
jgi:RNA polymerase sigma factor (sigma-70 family)